MKCPSGICIEKSLHMCDGQDDCGDGFDESVNLCGHLECPGYSFQCASGSCISKQLVCNGKADCFDGTDEAPLLCNTTTDPLVVTTSHPLVVQTGCPLPTEERPILTNIHGNQLTPPITRGTVKFSCNQGFFLVGSTSSVCSNRQWSVQVPKCVSEYRSHDLGAGISDLITVISPRILRLLASLDGPLEGSAAWLLDDAHVRAKWPED